MTNPGSHSLCLPASRPAGQDHASHSLRHFCFFNGDVFCHEVSHLSFR
uniref:Uncharacterized protein n=1 Tax=Rhizophora mucronata TaxID=61149 RepID=A0A2P2QAB5_RHIMU